MFTDIIEKRDKFSNHDNLLARSRIPKEAISEAQDASHSTVKAWEGSRGVGRQESSQHTSRGSDKATIHVGGIFVPLGFCMRRKQQGCVCVCV